MNFSEFGQKNPADPFEPTGNFSESDQRFNLSDFLIQCFADDFQHRKDHSRVVSFELMTGSRVNQPEIVAHSVGGELKGLKVSTGINQLAPFVDHHGEIFNLVDLLLQG